MKIPFCDLENYPSEGKLHLHAFFQLTSAHCFGLNMYIVSDNKGNSSEMGMCYYYHTHTHTQLWHNLLELFSWTLLHLLSKEDIKSNDLLKYCHHIRGKCKIGLFLNTGVYHSWHCCLPTKMGKKKPCSLVFAAFPPQSPGEKLWWHLPWKNVRAEVNRSGKKHNGYIFITLLNW